MSRKTVIFSILLIILILIGIFYFFIIPKKKFDGPVGGWEEYKVKIETRYKSREEDALNAALALAQVFQEAIDFPDKALEIGPRADKAIACFIAVFLRDGIDDRKAIEEARFIEDLMTNTFARQRRYISYNAKFSGMVIPFVESELKQCNFKLIGSK